jgi:hypothetical protein
VAIFAILLHTQKGAKMAITNLPVTSREYKLMLNVNRFKQRDEGIAAFFQLVKFLLDKEGGNITEEQNEEERRVTSYLDTPELALRQQNFSLRLRKEAEDSFQINLKYRASDRYVSAARDVSSSDKGKAKFEEDVMPPFISKFSHSITVKKKTPPELSTMEQVTALFPSLAALGLDDKTTVKTIKKFEAVEIVHKLCKFQFARSRAAKASLSFWYLPGDETNWPLVTEFSFDYDAPPVADGELESYPTALVTGANNLFSALQNQAGWIDPNGTTKTAFALDAL